MRILLIFFLALSINTSAQIFCKYPFAANLEDQVGNNDGSNHGAAYTIGHDGSSDHAISLNGSTYTEFTKLDDLASSLDSFFIGFNFKQNSFDAEMSSLFSNFNTAGSGQGLVIDFHRYASVYHFGRVLFYIRDKDGVTRSYAIEIDEAFDGNWHCLAFQKLGNNYKAFLDGVEQSKIEIRDEGPDNFGSFDYPFVIGARNNRGSIDNNFTGSIDNFIIGRGAYQPDSLYCDEIVNPETPRVFCKYPFGGDIKDQVGLNDGTNHGAEFGVGHDGSDNHSICLNGSEYTELTTLDELASSLDSFYIGFNFRQDSVDAKLASVFSNFNSGGSDQGLAIDFHKYASVYHFGRVLFYLRDKDGDTRSYVIDIKDAFDNQWHCLAFEKSGSTYKAYLDGVEQTKIDIRNEVPNNLGKFEYPFVVGARNNRGTIDQHFTGCLDNFVVGRGLYDPDSLYCDEIITLGIDDLAPGSNLEAYPNPINGSSIVIRYFKQPVDAYLINTLGQTIEINSIERSGHYMYLATLPELKNGYYVLRIVLIDGSIVSTKIYAN